MGAQLARVDQYNRALDIQSSGRILLLQIPVQITKHIPSPPKQRKFITLRIVQNAVPGKKLCFYDAFKTIEDSLKHNKPQES